MFYQTVSQLALADEVADELFKNINAPDYNGDVTLRVTLRALLEPRMPKDASFSACVLQHLSLEKGKEARFLESNLGNKLDGDMLYIVDYTGDGESTAEPLTAMQKALHDAFMKKYKGFVCDDKVNAWYLQPGAGASRVLVFKNAETRTTVVFVADLNVRRFHALQAPLPRLLPWFFEGENAAAPGSQDREFLHSLQSAFPEKIVDKPGEEKPGYTVLAARYADRYDFRTARINRYMTNLVATALASQRQNVENEISNVNSQISSVNSQLSSLYEQLDSLQTTLFGLNYREQNSTDDRLRAYFIANRNVDLVRMVGDKFRFATYAYMEWWNEDRIEAMLKNKNSILYNMGPHISKEDAGLFFRALFIDRKIRMRTCACYEMNLRRCEVSPVSDYEDFREMDTRMVNPHILHYGCIGSYAEQFRRAMVSGEYVSVIETAIASTKSVNPSDPSFDYMISDFRINIDKRFLETEDGRIVSIREAVKILKGDKEA